MGIKSFKKLVLTVQDALGAKGIIFKNDFSPLDNNGNVVSFKIGGYWNSMRVEDVFDYATMGGTN